MLTTQFFALAIDQPGDLITVFSAWYHSQLGMATGVVLILDATASCSADSANQINNTYSQARTRALVQQRVLATPDAARSNI